MQRLLFIYNPRAGTGQVKGKLSDMINAFTQAGCLTTVYPTQSRGDAARAARELAPQFDRVAVCGGDGTLHEVVCGLMDLPEEARPPIGYLPAGTTNDYARNLDLPKETVKMAHLAAAGTPRPVDIGRMGDKYFIYVAAFGAFADVAYNTPQEFKNAFGHLAYVLTGVSSLSSLKSYRMKVEYDGGELEGNFLYGMVSNTVSVGGVIGLPAREVSLSDGLLEAVLIYNPETLADLNDIIVALATQEYAPGSGVVALHSARFRFICDEPVPYTLDGEFGGERGEAVFSAVNTPVSIVYGK